ncbi:MAG: hypothetical protein IT442_09760 [Phycisphaeraceae bacterium]|nr:hypothetical protein [Phycisphaeraceae bacterium]
MPGSILPLPVMLEEEDRKIYEQLKPPESIVVRYGYQKLIAELPYDGQAKFGCGSKVVIRTNRGIEIGEMLTTTCPNSGCAKAVSRQQMLDYIENSGGKNFPFTDQGKVVRLAEAEDMIQQQRLDAGKTKIMASTKAVIREMNLPMHLVEVEFLLGGDRIIFYYTSEQWVDFRELVKRLAAEHHTRIEMHQVNAREEARLAADYERCGQHCCCKQFLKVLKPVSMKSAKIQKATLDPTKISGRCGRLMCCLRYEDQTYDELRKRLPRKQTRVVTPEGFGTVIDTQIITQLVLVRLDHEAGQNAYPLENLTFPQGEELAKLEAESRAREEARLAAIMRRPEPRRDMRPGPGGVNGPGGQPGGPPRRDGQNGAGRPGPSMPQPSRGPARRPEAQPDMREMDQNEPAGPQDVDELGQGPQDEPSEQTPNGPQGEGTGGQAGQGEGGGPGAGQGPRRRRGRRRRGGRGRRGGDGGGPGPGAGPPPGRSGPSGSGGGQG